MNEDIIDQDKAVCGNYLGLKYGIKWLGIIWRLSPKNLYLVFDKSMKITFVVYKLFGIIPIKLKKEQIIII